MVLIKYLNTFFFFSDYASIDEEDRSSIFLISFHYLLHLAESIEDFGLCRGYWQFPMERICGMLIPLVKSQIHPYANLWNNLVLNERFNHLKYKTKFYERIFPSKEKSNGLPTEFLLPAYIENLNFILHQKNLFYHSQN